MISFEKISFEQYMRDYVKAFGPTSEKKVRSIYDQIILPIRKTKGSAGYDFHLPYPITLSAGTKITILTGIRVQMPTQVVLLLAPRSGLGTKYQMHLANTVGVIDSDYIQADNEGHIMAVFYALPKEPMPLKAGESFMQGIFLPYLLTDGDIVDHVRRGGFGSTD